MSRTAASEWVSGYERAWRSPGTSLLRELFTEGATYRLSPYDEPLVGLPAIEAMWERERDGPDEVFTMAGEVVVADREVAVVRVEVTYSGPPAQEYRDLWIIRFAPDGRCKAFEEWPFWPGQERIAQGRSEPS